MEHAEPDRKRRPTHIDIYVDGSWLFKGKNNLAEAGGWGALIIETYADGDRIAWMPSGPTPSHVTSNIGAEIEAAAAALRAIQVREDYRPGEAQSQPKIILHSDQIGWPDYVKKLRENPALAPTSKNAQIHDMARTLISMNGTAEYRSHNKSTYKFAKGKGSDEAAMSIPHDLASRHAWGQRLEQQGHLQFGPDRLQPRPGEENEDFIRRLFPIDLTVLGNRSR